MYQKHIKIQMELTADTPNSMSFADVYDGLKDPWYLFEANAHGGVNLCANEDGFEFLARFFLKMARGQKANGYHSHDSLELGKESFGEPELTIVLQSSER
jgi:hypothetical protein